MRPSPPSIWSATLVALAIASLADARSATVKDPARLRVGPGAGTELVGELPAGSIVDILGESGGWRQVQTGDGRTGYLWSEHLVEEDGEAKPADTARAPAQAGRTVLDEVRALRDDVAALRDRPAATTADVERLRAEIERLSGTQQVLSRRLDERLLPAASTPSADGAGGGLGPLVFLLGGVVGWVASRVFQRRRDHRQGKIRF